MASNSSPGFGFEQGASTRRHLAIPFTIAGFTSHLALTPLAAVFSTYLAARGRGWLTTMITFPTAIYGIWASFAHWDYSPYGSGKMLKGVQMDKRDVRQLLVKIESGLAVAFWSLPIGGDRNGRVLCRYIGTIWAFSAMWSWMDVGGQAVKIERVEKEVDKGKGKAKEKTVALKPVKEEEEHDESVRRWSEGGEKEKYWEETDGKSTASTEEKGKKKSKKHHETAKTIRRSKGRPRLQSA